MLYINSKLKNTKNNGIITFKVLILTKKFNKLKLSNTKVKNESIDPFNATGKDGILTQPKRNSKQ